MILSFCFLVAGVLLLWVGSEGLVRSSETLALRSGVSPLVTGLTVVAFGTSAPELVASVVAALTNSPDMALGNVIGSNIGNIGLVLGIAAVVTPIVVHRHAVRVDAPIALLCTVVLIILLLMGDLGRLEGIVLVVGILIYTVVRIRNSRSLDTVLSEEVKEHTLDVPNPTLYAILIGSLIGLTGGAFLFVQGAKALAEHMGVSEAVIGLTIMAVGTSLPEIATVIAAARKGLSDLVIGNVIGSNIFNILSVLGVTSVIVPLHRQNVHNVDLFVFGGSAVILLGMMMRPKIGRLMGALLIAGYVAYVVYLYVQ
ncbi:MAG: calcium/sodium antiporter [Rhodothermales bacterium]